MAAAIFFTTLLCKSGIMGERVVSFITLLLAPISYIWSRPNFLHYRLVLVFPTHTTYRKNNKLEKCAGMGLNDFHIK